MRSEKPCCPCMEPDCDGSVGTCKACGKADVPVDGQGVCYPCFEDAMFAEDDECVG